MHTLPRLVIVMIQVKYTSHNVRQRFFETACVYVCACVSICEQWMEVQIKKSYNLRYHSK